MTEQEVKEVIRKVIDDLGVYTEFEDVEATQATETIYDAIKPFLFAGYTNSGPRPDILHVAPQLSEPSNNAIEDHPMKWVMTCPECGGGPKNNYPADCHHTCKDCGKMWCVIGGMNTATGSRRIKNDS